MHLVRVLTREILCFYQALINVREVLIQLAVSALHFLLGSDFSGLNLALRKDFSVLNKSLTDDSPMLGWSLHKDSKGLHFTCTHRIFQMACAVPSVAAHLPWVIIAPSGRPEGRVSACKSTHFGDRLSLYPFCSFRRLLPAQHLLCCGHCRLFRGQVTSRQPLGDTVWSWWGAVVWILTRNSRATSVVGMVRRRSWGWRGGAVAGSRLLHGLGGA